jgi:hypothetical protein
MLRHTSQDRHRMHRAVEPLTAALGWVNYSGFFWRFLTTIHPKRNTHKKLPIGTNKEIKEAQRIGSPRTWRTRSASGSIGRTIKYPKIWPGPAVFIEKYPIHRQAIRNSDKVPVTHQTDFQKPSMAEIHLMEISATAEIKIKLPRKIIIHQREQDQPRGLEQFQAGNPISFIGLDGISDVTLIIKDGHF